MEKAPEPIVLRAIEQADDAAVARIARYNLKHFGLDIPGTAYFDPELERLHAFYGERPASRAYFVAQAADGTVLGGGGLAEFPGFAKCAEVQKFYLADEAKGRGVGRRLLERVEAFAREAGYARLYLETHERLTAAIRLYEKNGFVEIEKPAGVNHGAMNRFYKKELL